LQEAIISGLQLYLSNAVLRSVIDTRNITSLFVSGGRKTVWRSILALTGKVLKDVFSFQMSPRTCYPRVKG
jgi:hypothetical protein